MNDSNEKEEIWWKVAYKCEECGFVYTAIVEDRQTRVVICGNCDNTLEYPVASVSPSKTFCTKFYFRFTIENNILILTLLFSVEI